MSAPTQSTKAAGIALAAQHLEAVGFELIDRERETRYGAIDLIVADAQRIVFCDVQVRRSGGTRPFGGIGEAQTRRLRRIAAAWLIEQRDRPRPLELRFDTILVVVDGDGRLVSLRHSPASR